MMQAPDKLECRLVPDILFIPFLLGVVVIGLSCMEVYDPHPNLKDNFAITVLTLAFMGLPSIWIFLWYLRARIIADDRGLLFQGAIRRRFVPWEDVEDYYYGLAPEGNKETRDRAFVVISGKPKSLSRNFKPFDLLLNFVAEHATSARVTHWERKETRNLGEWPKIFVFQSTSGWKLLGAYLAFTAAYLAVFALRFSSGSSSSGGDILSLWEFLSPTAKFGFILAFWFQIGFIPLLVFLRYPAIRRQRRYAGQAIEATQAGLTLKNAGQDSFVAWEEIRSYHREAVPGFLQLPIYVLETAHGRQELPGGLVNMRELLALISARATHASTTEWNYLPGRDDEALANTLLPNGERRFHYRTRTNRAYLLVFSFILLGALIPTLLMPVRYREGLPQDEVSAWMAPILLLLLVPLLYGWHAWFRSYLTVDERGLMQVSLWGQRCIPWHEIQSLSTDGVSYSVKSTQMQIRFGAVADVRLLCDEVARRAINAVPQRWKKDSDKGESSYIGV